MEPPAKRRKLPRWLPQVAGYALSAVCVIWVLHDYSIRKELIPAIRELDWRWVSLALGAEVATIIVQGFRWNTLLAPVSELGLWRTVQAIFIGQFANLVLPLRTGEIIRCYLLAHWNNLRLSLGLASAALERLIDGIWMLAAFLVTAAFLRSMPKDLIVGVQILGFVLIVGVVLVAWTVFHKQHAHAAIRESRWASTLRHVIEGLHLMGNPRTMGWTSLVSLGYLAVQVVKMWALLKAYQMDLSFWQAGGILAVIRLAIVLPSGPGNLGLLQVGCYAALRLFDVGENESKNLCNITYFAENIPLLFGGAIAVALTGLNISELRERARHGLHAHSHESQTHQPH